MVRKQLGDIAPTPGGRLRAFIHYGRQRSVGDDCSICPLGALQSDFESFPESLRERTSELTKAVHALVTELLQSSRDQGEVTFAGDPSACAWTLMSTLQGARQNARVAGAELHDQIIDQVLGELFHTGLIHPPNRP